MTNEQTRLFIASHLNDDVRALALKGCRDTDVDIDFALRQIAGWQTARRKLPAWAEVEGLVYPPHLSMEQCSGQPAALYKKRLAMRLLDGNDRATGVDLTGGFGVDFSFMAGCYHHAVYVERQEELCRIARHNMPLLGIDNAEVVCDEAEHYISCMDRADIIYMDPARRDPHGARTYSISDCTPDVAELLPQLLDKSRFVIVKLSPMLDWKKAADDLGGKTADNHGNKVAEIHIVSTGGECRELLLVIDSERNSVASPDIYCVADDMVTMIGADEQVRMARIAADGYHQWGGTYLYVPDTSLMKSGCWGAISSMFGVEMIAANSHLFISRSRLDDFPGRTFVIDDVSTMNKRELKRMLGGITKANIAVRNFPLTANQLRQRLKMGDGGDCFLFATTTHDGTHVIIKGRSIKHFSNHKN